MHVLLDNSDLLPVLVNITSARQHDLAFARSLDLAAGTIITLDRGYMDLSLFWKWDKAGIFFVTRFKKGMLYKTQRKLQLSEGSQIISDTLVKLHSFSGKLQYPKLIRRVELLVEDREGGQKPLVLMTNLLDLPAEDIALIYKERWQIELFFKTVKQNLPLRHFVGQSRNAIEIQIWTALLALLLLKWMQYSSSGRWSLSNLAAALRLNLFTHRTLEDFLNSPWDPPPEPEHTAQLCLHL
jgi:IS4 transposase